MEGHDVSSPLKVIVALCLLIVLFLGVGILGLSSPVLAAPGDPISEDVTVTATVPSLSPPPVPILVRPSNNSFVHSGLVEFQWREVTGHIYNLARYEISLNGVKRFDLPLGNDESIAYSIKLIDRLYSLVLDSSARLNDGSYTWKIRVIDVHDKGTDSATWQFTLDSAPPPIIVTNIQGQEYSISASDPTTIPVDPVIVLNSQPFVYGSTESSAEVQLIVLRADGTQSNYKMTATADGHFLFYLPTLNADEIVGLTFTAIDFAGNTRVLTGLRIRYVPRRITISLPNFVPDQPDIVISIPQLPGFFQPSPPPLQPDAPPSGSTSVPGDDLRPVVVPVGQQVFERPVTSLGSWRWVLLLLLFGYSLWVFLWTGNRWVWYLSWFGQLVRWWLLWPDGASVVATRQGTPLPWILLQLEWLESGGVYRQRRLWSTASGSWDLPGRFLSLATLSIRHPNWSWGGESTYNVPPGFTPVRSLSLVRPDAVRSPELFSATPISGQGRLWLSLLLVQKSEWRWKFRWWPRVWLLASLCVASWLAYRVPVTETFGWLALCIWLLLRDVQGRLPERWKVWKESP